MAKQTFTTGQVLTAAQMTSLQETAMTGGPASTKTVSYVLVAADAGTRVAMNAAGSTTITVNTGLFSAGDTVSIQNIGAGVCTVTAGTATVNTSGSLVLAQYQGGILYFTSASAAIFFQFATPASGDIEGVTAGTGISGGGTSGTVTITNDMATTITASGDIVVGTGSGTYDNLPIGSTGQVLTADTTVSPYKVKWAVDPVADVVTTAGDLIYATAADTVTRLGIGTAGQVLKVNSGATAPEWGSVSTGTWTQAATGSLSGATVSITGLTGKKYAVFLVKYSHNSASAAYLECYLNNDNTAKYYPFTDPSPTNPMTPCGVTTFASSGTRNDGFYVDMADTALDYKIIQPITPKNNSENGGLYNSTSAITEINLKMTSGSFDAGTYYVWSFA